MTVTASWELDREHEDFRASVRAFVDRYVRPVVDESEEAPGFGPRASIALPTAAVGPMAAEASVSAMYAPKIAAISDPGERAAFVDARLAEQRADINLLRLASELVVDSIVEPAGLRAELIGRLADAAHWTRGPQRRHHHISPV
jgi:acetyl-CoA carboxylase carboxyltransferase component